MFQEESACHIWRHFLICGTVILWATKESLEAKHIEGLGPTHYEVFKSIDVFDPNGHRLELAANIHTADQIKRLRKVVPGCV